MTRLAVTDPALMGEIYQIEYHTADLLRALLTWDVNYIEQDIARIRLSLAALESKLSTELRAQERSPTA
jgi:hypothetical protein